MKSLINTPLLKEQLKRFWVIGVVPMLVYLLGVVLPLYSTNEWDLTAQSRNIVNVLSMSNPVLIFMMIVVPFCAAMALYPYHFNERATTAFYSFPITKRQLFWTNFAAGAILILLPLVILTVILLIPIRFNPDYSISTMDGVSWAWSRISLPLVLFPEWLAEGATINTFGLVMGFFARIVLGFMFYFSLFLVAVSVAGNRVISVLLSGAFPLVPMAIHALLWLIGGIYVFGMGDTMSNRFANTAAYTNPVMWWQIISQSDRINSGNFIGHLDGIPNLLIHAIVYIAIGVALLVTAYVCSHKRKLERTGESVVFTSLKNALVFTVATLGMIGTAALMASIMRNRFGWYLGGVIGFILAYFIAQMIAEKAFNIFKPKAKPLLYFGGIMISAYIVVLLITTFGMGFYVNRVPAQEDVQGVWLQHVWNQRWELPVITDSDTISHTIDIHNEIINNRSYLRRVFWQNMAGASGHHMLPITYVLHDGTRIHRTYTVSRGFMERHGIDELLDSRPVLLATASQVLRNPEDVAGVRLNLDRTLADYDGIDFDEIMSIGIQGAGIERLLEAITEDFLRDRRGWDTCDWTDGQTRWITIDFQQQSGVFLGSINLTFFRDGEIMGWLLGNGYLDRVR